MHVSELEDMFAEDMFDDDMFVGNVVESRPRERSTTPDWVAMAPDDDSPTLDNRPQGALLSTIFHLWPIIPVFPHETN